MRKREGILFSEDQCRGQNHAPSTPSLEPKQLFRAPPLFETALAYICMELAFNIVWFNWVIRRMCCSKIKSASWLILIGMSGTGRPKLLFKSLNRHRQAGRFGYMQNASVLLQIVPWLHVIFSDSPRTSYWRGISLLWKRNSVLHSVSS